jgi:hypothetical protein
VRRDLGDTVADALVASPAAGAVAAAPEEPEVVVERGPGDTLN